MTEIEQFYSNCDSSLVSLIQIKIYSEWKDYIYLTKSSQPFEKKHEAQLAFTSAIKKPTLSIKS